MPYLSVKAMPDEERPRERLLKQGATALADRELLAIILRTGTAEENALDLARRLLSSYGGLEGLARVEAAQLLAEPGIGPAKAAQVLAALELGRRVATLTPEARPQVTSPADAARLLVPMLAYQSQEHFVILYLDTRHRLLDQETLYRGSLNSAPARTAEVFRGAVRRNCAAILVAHNHPSGDPEPSLEDIRFTERLIEAGQLLEIEVLDHLIIGANRYISLRERGHFPATWASRRFKQGGDV